MTRFVSKIKVKRRDDILETWNRFLSGEDVKERGEFGKKLERVWDVVEPLLDEEMDAMNRWVLMQDDWLFDKKINGCWYKLNGSQDVSGIYPIFNSGTSLRVVKNNLKEKWEVLNKYEFDLPTFEEVKNSLWKPNSAPFSVKESYRPYGYCGYFNKSHSYVIILNSNKVYDCDSCSGAAIPLLRIYKENSFELSDREIFFWWVVKGLIPQKLKENKEYLSLVNDYYYKVDDFNVEYIAPKIDKEVLLNIDTKRVNLSPYPQKMLTDINKGHWDIWEIEDKSGVELDEPIVARDPRADIKDGIVAIDFGTKSTVVVVQEESAKAYPLRIGIGDVLKEVGANDYENPTILEFNNLNQFLEDYSSKENRPFTKWEDVTVSHTAYERMINSDSKYLNSFFDRLKQWAGEKELKWKIIDKRGNEFELKPFLEIEEELNPIEIYAYYLGSYINNMFNGVYKNYILSFPVTYEVKIREKILESFKRGIQKSLPKGVGEIEVYQGASEPAAYAITALEEYGFRPDGKKIYYGVFDFGGGTTDFDYGVFREADNSRKERRYDYVIEHFGAGGCKYLGGENLLELLAFEVFKDNKKILLEEKIQFAKPYLAEKFAGMEPFVSELQEARLNIHQLKEKLRGFWEEREKLENGEIGVNLFDVDGEVKNIKLSVNSEKLREILKTKIEKGVKSFFEGMREAFVSQNLDFKDLEDIKIILAGNSSKSSIVKEVFEKEIEKIKQEANLDNPFTLLEPLADEDLEKPNAKTGVAFGLIKARKGGKILVKDLNVKEEIKFKYFLGEERRGKFVTLIERNTPYNKWIPFIDAGLDTFEVFYSSSPIVTTNQVDIEDSSIKKLSLKIDVVDEDADVYIRLVSPDTFEYVVAYEDGIKNEEYLGEIKKVRI